MFQHERGGPKRADGIGDAFPRDVERSAVDWLEHGRKAPLGIQVSGRSNSEAARKGGSKVGKNVGVQVGGHDGVKTRGLAYHASGHRIDEHFVPADIWKFS